MTNKSLNIRQLVLGIVFLSFFNSYAQTRKVVQLENWKFIKGDVNKAHEISFDDATWQDIIVPHDWAIYGPFNKEIDKQIVAIEQNGEKIPTEKT